MIALLETVLGSKVGRWIAEALLIVLLLGSVALYLEHRGAAGELAKLQKSSAALVQSAENQIASMKAREAVEAQLNQEKLDEALTTRDAAVSVLDQRVRDFDAYRRAHPGVESTAGSAGGANRGECGAVSCGDLASELAVRGDELARSVGDLSATLQACQRDRDSLTGLPR